MLGQAETIVERGYQAVMQGGTQFGHADDGVKFGITVFALFAVVGTLAYLYIASERSSLKEAKTRIGELEKEIKDNAKSYEGKYDDLREEGEKRLSAYWGIFDIALRELATNNRWLQGQGLVPRQHETPPVQMPPPAANGPAPAGRASFLPGAQPMRRIPPSPHGGPREGRIKLGGQDENAS